MRITVGQLRRVIKESFGDYDKCTWCGSEYVVGPTGFCEACHMHDPDSECPECGRSMALQSKGDQCDNCDAFIGSDEAESYDDDETDDLFDFADGLTRESVDEQFPGALSEWGHDEDGFPHSDDEPRTLISVDNGKLYSEPDAPQTPWVWVPDESEWHQIDEAGYEELAD